MKRRDGLGLEPRGHTIGGDGSTKRGRRGRMQMPFQRNKQQKLVTDCTKAVKGEGEWKGTGMLSWAEAEKCRRLASLPCQCFFSFHRTLNSGYLNFLKGAFPL